MRVGTRMSLPSRLTSLDGLRGIASFVVLCHHALLTSPNFAAIYFGGEPQGFVANALVFTPLPLRQAVCESPHDQ